VFSDTDIHYISGFLYLASGGAIESATLGERIRDTASGTDRDVDIVIKRAGGVAFIAAEVKDETRPLDITTVEQLCAKLTDMPTIETRAIISSSGYTAPARRKAATHGVSCLTLVHAPLPPFPTVDLTQLPGITLVEGTWVDGPHVHLAPTVQLSEPERQALLGATVRYNNPEELPCTVDELANRVARAVHLERGAEQTGRAPVRILVQLTENPIVEILDRTIVITEALVTGETEFTERLIPFEATCYLADEQGHPFAASAIIMLNGGLLGLTVTRDGRDLRAFSIPENVRDVRPTRVRIG
jgi:hypothetical protein